MDNFGAIAVLLANIRFTFRSKNGDMSKKIYTTHARPRYENEIRFWHPYFKKHVDKLEKMGKCGT